MIAIETTATPYPLGDGLVNNTAAALDEIIPGAGQMGADAVAGRAQGGAPTLESWDAHLRALARSESDAAAAMLIAPTFNMFPDMRCDSGSLFICALMRRMQSIQDPAPQALIEIAMAEQQNNAAGAIAAMQRAQSSPLRDHPALGASYALAILRFNDANVAQARAAGLPTDVAALQNRALLALPYNPGYWTDVGDRYAAQFDYQNAFVFYDVAFSLPLPSAMAANPALQGKRQQMERVRRDFPDMFLPAAR